MSDSNRILFLYSEVMPYTISVINSLVKDFKCKVLLVHWDHKKLTPFSFELRDITATQRTSVDLQSLKKQYDKFNPDLVYVSGRMDKLYLKIAKIAKKDGRTVVMGSDKQWNGSIKDWIAKALSGVLYHKYFSHVWVSGPRQEKYAKEMFFTSDKIIHGVYAADTSLFNKHKITNDESRNDVLFIGRLVDYKGIIEVINSLKELKTSGTFRGRLLVYGNGPLLEDLPNYNWIVYKGFGNQESIFKNLSSIRLFVLPSWKEPWGVVIHEMASAGLPIICSSACGAGDVFVEDGVNGFIVRPRNEAQLKDRIKKILNGDTIELVRMSERSKELASQYTPKKSAQALLSILD